MMVLTVCKSYYDTIVQGDIYDGYLSGLEPAILSDVNHLPSKGDSSINGENTLKATNNTVRQTWNSHYQEAWVK